MATTPAEADGHPDRAIQETVTIEPLRSLQHKDTEGNAISKHTLFNLDYARTVY